MYISFSESFITVRASMVYRVTRFIIVAGTRPEIIKVAPIIREILKRKKQVVFVHTGQHYDFELSRQMIDDLDLPFPDLSFKLRNNSPISQVAEIMTKLEPVFTKRGNRDIVIVQGDTNSVLSAALGAVKCRIPVAHVEAGLRSRDWKMPEEHNRRMVDHISDYLFAPTKLAKKNLEEEMVYGRIFVTGNTVIDAVNQHLPLAEKKSKIDKSIPFSKYCLATIHRSENVDVKKILTNIVNGLIYSRLPIILPLHPRTRKMLISYKLYDSLLSCDTIYLMPPQGYLDFLKLMKNSKLIVTDSGGIQEESTSPQISKKVLILRTTTERQEAIMNKFAKLIDLRGPEIARNMTEEWDRKTFRAGKSPFGDGHTSARILDILEK